MGVKEFFQEYGWVLLVLIILVSAIVFVLTGGFYDSSLDLDGDLNSAIKPFDLNDNVLSIEHIALAENQQFILNEIQKLNLFSQCAIDTNSIRTVEVPLDNAGAFRRVSLITLVCPELTE